MTNSESETTRGWRRTATGREPINPRMQAIVAALRDGESYRRIGDRFEICVQRVAQIGRYAGMRRRMRIRNVL